MEWFRNIVYDVVPQLQTFMDMNMVVIKIISIKI